MGNNKKCPIFMQKPFLLKFVLSIFNNEHQAGLKASKNDYLLKTEYISARLHETIIHLNHSRFQMNLRKLYFGKYE